MQNKPKFGEVELFQWITYHVPLGIDIERNYLRAKQELQLLLEVPASKRSLPKPVEPADQGPPKTKHDGIQRFEMTNEEWREKADKARAQYNAELERSRNQNPSVPVERAASAETTRDGKPIESSPIKSGNKTAPNLALAPVCSNSVTTSSTGGSETQAAESPNPECDAESVKSVLTRMASRSIAPSSEGLLGFHDDNGCMIWIRVTKREEGFVAEFLKRDRVIAAFGEGELKAELKKARMQQ